MYYIEKCTTYRFVLTSVISLYCLRYTKVNINKNNFWIPVFHLQQFSIYNSHFLFHFFKLVPVYFAEFIYTTMHIITRVSRFFDNNFVTLSWIAIRFQHNFFTSQRNIPHFSYTPFLTTLQTSLLLWAW